MTQKRMLNRASPVPQRPTAKSLTAVRFLVIAAPIAIISVSTSPASAQDWVDNITGRIERHDFDAQEPLAHNRYLLPDDVGPARRFDFSAETPYVAPKDVPPDFDPNATPRQYQLNPIERPPEPPKEPTR